MQYNSTYISDINILNKSTLLGTSSDANGRFSLFAKKGDSLLFSSIMFKNRIVKVTETHIKSKSITVYLEPSYLQLDQIMLNKVLVIDWGKASVTKGTILNNDNITNRKAPDARKLTDPNSNAGGLNPTAIFLALTKKARLKRKKRRVEKERNHQIKNKFPTTIRVLYGNDFFVEWLHIPEENINLLIDYCEGNGLSEFYNSNEILIKNFLFVQAKKFNSIRN
ncbi:MAG: hypothetical protein COB01_05295 [Lutibacter sp.]|nr:MAG: hypothetical protein COB01_05295 [Lutibacter sp.]